ncbi:hypothetical protein Vspart_00848 [Vibrio spartinae]|uniref:Uncharacterized protein n=1 Tax=Vibrio spartinae TaxID=1918945 RepID=A0ABX6QX64_9VIBR|nr:hypothetical protein Vspart_00848 [Vibrio spartinae]
MAIDAVLFMLCWTAQLHDLGLIAFQITCYVDGQNGLRMHKHAKPEYFKAFATRVALKSSGFFI